MTMQPDCLSGNERKEVLLRRRTIKVINSQNKDSKAKETIYEYGKAKNESSQETISEYEKFKNESSQVPKKTRTFDTAPPIERELVGRNERCEHESWIDNNGRKHCLRIGECPPYQSCSFGRCIYDVSFKYRNPIEKKKMLCEGGLRGIYINGKLLCTDDSRPHPVPCGPDEEWDGKRCARSPPYYADGFRTCPQGYQWDDYKCIPDVPNSTPVCPDPTVWNGKLCTYDFNRAPEPHTNCPQGYHHDGNNCVPDVPSYQGYSQVRDCPQGYSWNGTTCIPSTFDYTSQAPPGCPPGYTWTGTVCEQPNMGYPDKPPVTCPPGMRLENNTCVRYDWN